MRELAGKRLQLDGFLYFLQATQTKGSCGYSERTLGSGLRALEAQIWSLVLPLPMVYISLMLPPGAQSQYQATRNLMFLLALSYWFTHVVISSEITSIWRPLSQNGVDSGGTSSFPDPHLYGPCLQRPQIRALRFCWGPYSRATFHLERPDIIETALRDIRAGAGELHPLALEILLVIDGYLNGIEWANRVRTWYIRKKEAQVKSLTFVWPCVFHH